MQGIIALQPLVAKLMRKEQIKSIFRRKYRVTTNSLHIYLVVANKLIREFKVLEQIKVWVSDITYISTVKGWLYLTTVIDIFDKKVIGWALSETMRTENAVIGAFKMATINRSLKGTKEFLFHSDRGIQYACVEFKEELARYKVV